MLFSQDRIRTSKAESLREQTTISKLNVTTLLRSWESFFTLTPADLRACNEIEGGHLIMKFFPKTGILLVAISFAGAVNSCDAEVLVPVLGNYPGASVIVSDNTVV